eukprot:PhM_4_TR371/c0_g1_i1/m.67940
MNFLPPPVHCEVESPFLVHIFLAAPISGQRFVVLEVVPSTTILRLRHAMKEKLRGATKLPTISLDADVLEDDVEVGSLRLHERSAHLYAHRVTEVIIINTACVDNPVQVPWTPHSTVTDVVKAAYSKYKVPLDLCRIIIDVSADGVVNELPIRNTYTVRSDALRWELTVAEVGFDKGFVHVRRSRDGVPETLLLELAPNSTIRDVHNAVNDLCRDQAAFDDDDEELAPHGSKFLFLYRSVDDRYDQADLTDPVNYLSYVRQRQYPPSFVPIENDYTVRHLTDVGVLPGAELRVEFFCPWTQIWSGDVPTMLKLNDNDDTITIRSRAGLFVRVPTSVDDTFGNMKLKLWCACNDNPMFTMLMTEDGVILQEHMTLRQLRMSTDLTLYARAVPKAWESPEVSKPTATESWGNLEDDLFVRLHRTTKRSPVE